MSIYFAYGSNMYTERLKSRAHSAVPIGRAKLPNKRLVFNKKGYDGSGRANLLDSSGETTWGVLYEIGSSDIPKLDKYELGYTRFNLCVINDGDLSVESFVYISSEATDGLSPSDSYMNFLTKGAYEHHLPEFYVKYLEQITSQSFMQP